MKIFAIKIIQMDGEKPETHNFLVKAETYGRAETMGYEIAGEFGWKTFKIDSVVKKQIHEVHKSVDGECTMWLVAYEFGLEAKPEKSNVLYAGKDVEAISDMATRHLSEYCDSLFIKEIKYQDFQEFIDDSDNEKSFEEKVEKGIEALKENTGFNAVFRKASLLSEKEEDEFSL